VLRCRCVADLRLRHEPVLVRNPKQLLSEVFRVLRPGGRFVMTNIDRMTLWAMYQYFPEALTLDARTFCLSTVSLTR
jgi:ubiquinone/menaquinone biosynthesis C-methylase UbiE